MNVVHNESGLCPATYRTDEVYYHEVTIKIDNDSFDETVIEASSFRFDASRCLFQDDRGQDVFVHEIAVPKRDDVYACHPWSDSHGLEVTFDWAARFKMKMSICHPKVQLNGIPKYTFKGRDGYVKFNSELCGRRFVDDFWPNKIHTNSQDSGKQVIKVWQDEHLLTGNKFSVIIPLPEKNGVTRQLRFEELRFDWFTCEKVNKSFKTQADARKLKLDLDPMHRPVIRQKRRESDQSRWAPIKTKMTWTSSASSAKRSTRNDALDDSPIHPLHQRLFNEHKSFEITFDTEQACLRFQSLHKDSVLNPEVPILNVRSPLSPPPPRPSPSHHSKSESASSMISTPSRPQSGSDFAPSPTSQSRRSIATTETPPTERQSIGPQTPQHLNLGTSTHEIPTISTELGPPALFDSSSEYHRMWRKGGPKNIFQVKEDFLKNNQVYSKLEERDEIRLLRIDRGEYDSDLTCKLVHVHLAQAHSYEAVSYCWGDASETLDITIEADRSRKFTVSKHLWEGLKRLRCSNRDRLVWIDAVCINQNDTDEKTHQLPQMGEIYRRALRTLIWIGNRSLESPNCGRDYKAKRDGPGAPNLVCATMANSSSIEEHSDISDLTRHLLHFQQELSRKDPANVWWRRLFVLQEFAFSTKPPVVYIGPHSIDWEYFVYLFGSSQAETKPLALFEELESRKQYPLFDLLRKSGSFHCADPRDRIYGLLSMTPGVSEVIKPDYNKSVLQVQQEACDYMIQTGRSVDVLLDGRSDRRIWGSYKDLFPTWMPELASLLDKQAMSGPNEEWRAGTADSELSNVPSQVELLAAPSSDDFDRPGILKIQAIEFGRIVSRTTENDIGDCERYAGGRLIYNSLEIRGMLLDSILNRLAYDEDAPNRWDLERDPGLGRLILVYLFETTRSYGVEVARRRTARKVHYETYCKTQREKDRQSVRDQHGDFADLETIDRRWDIKIKRGANEDKKEIFIPERMRKALGKNRTSINEDFDIARDFENLFAYARTTVKRYYFNGNNYDAPIQRDVLQCTTPADFQELQSQWSARLGTDPEPEYHEYNAKNRKRDFFMTQDGFIGLGPSTLEVDDIVIVPLGSSRPWIVRPCPDEPEKYTFVGEAVVHGLMSGKLVLRDRKEPKDFPRTFLLR